MYKYTVIYIYSGVPAEVFRVVEGQYRSCMIFTHANMNNHWSITYNSVILYFNCLLFN